MESFNFLRPGFALSQGNPSVDVSVPHSLIPHRQERGQVHLLKPFFCVLHRIEELRLMLVREGTGWPCDMAGDQVVLMRAVRSLAVSRTPAG